MFMIAETVTNKRISCERTLSIWFQEVTKFQQYKQRIISKSTKCMQFIYHKTQKLIGSTKFIQ